MANAFQSPAQLSGGLSFNGIKVVLSAHALTRRWVFPVERFVTYEPKDEPWCRYFGIGHEVTEPCEYMIRDSFGPVWGVRSDMCDTMVIHPELWEKMKADPRVVVEGGGVGDEVGRDRFAPGRIMAGLDGLMTVKPPSFVKLGYKT